MDAETEVYRKIACRLEQRRIDIGMSKRRLSILSGITPVYLREVLRGDRKPSVVVLMDLCSALNIKLSKILSEIESCIDM
ncbi:MAG: helix-turn-helix transcriptional regulator [Desulfovibrio sp.]|nr:helix-turn-helix transcriptional regulator [Desulfovibrio sp.]